MKLKNKEKDFLVSYQAHQAQLYQEILIAGEGINRTGEGIVRTGYGNKRGQKKKKKKKKARQDYKNKIDF